MRSALRTRILPAGLAALLACLVTAAAGMNTGNNLLILLLSVGAAWLLVARILTRRAARRLEITFEPPAEVFAGREEPVRVEVRNRGRSAIPPLCRVELVGGVRAEPILLPALRGSAAVGREIRAVFPRRGPADIGAEGAASFPGALFESRAASRSRARVLVYPALLAEDGGDPASGDGSGDEAGTRPGGSADLLDLREYRPGEDARAIHWKATARAGRPIVRIGAREEERSVALVVDPTVDRPGETSQIEMAERAVSRGAAAAVRLAQERRPVRLLLPGGPTASGGSGTTDLRSILEALALVPVEGPALPFGWWRGSLRPGETPLVFRATDSGP